MKKLLLMLAAACLVLGVATTPAVAGHQGSEAVGKRTTDTQDWNYRVCSGGQHAVDGGWPWVCLKAVGTRQSDGIGVDWSRVHIYAFIGSSRTDPDPGRNDCDRYVHSYEGTAVDTVDPVALNVQSVTAAGDVTVKWFRQTDLHKSDTPPCDAIWSGLSISTNTVDSRVKWAWKMKLDGNPDYDGMIGIRLWQNALSDNWWGCLDSGDADDPGYVVCDRSLA